MAARSKDTPVAKSKPPTTTSTTTTSSSASTTAAATTESSTVSVAAPAKPSRAGDRSKNGAAVAIASLSTATRPHSTTGVSSGSGSGTGATTTSTAPVSSSAMASATPTSTEPSAVTVVTSSSSPVENGPPPPAQSDLLHCALCGGESSSSPDDMMQCLCCASMFHARCANLPQTPEEGDTFCRWECFSAFRKSQTGGAPSKTPLGDFSKLAAKVHSMLSDAPRHGGGGGGHHAPLNSPQAHAHHHQVPGSARDPQAMRLRERGKRGVRGSNGRSRSPSPYHSHEGSDRGPNGYSGDRERPRRASPSAHLPSQPPSFSGHVDLTLEDDGESSLPPPRSPRSRPPRGSATNRPPMDEWSFDDAEELRNKRQKYLPLDDPIGNGGARAGGSTLRRDSYPPPPSRRGLSPSANGGYANDIPPHYPGGGDPRLGFPPGPTGRGARMAPMEDEQLSNSHPSSGRSTRPGSGGANRYIDTKAEDYGPGARGVPPPPSRSRPSSAEEGSNTSSTSRRGRGPHPADAGASRQMPVAAAMPPPGRYSIPWLNPAAFPAGLRERFHCKPDNVNGVFRIDLSPVFADKSTHLYQSEIDFFFRCFESADVSLVVKGIASDLNQYIWAWPFILESCGSETHFSFDHFQFRHSATSGGDMPELEYVGELRLSMAAYNAYLERYLSGRAMGNDVVVLEDHATKKPISLVASDNILVLNNLVIAEHCAQLYNDLIKSFQWDVFAGGIHCLLQYLPQANRHKRFASPLLHFNFPGARGRLRDPGNGTTDTAYQVLTGSLELVVFERLEPKDRDTFLRVLHAAGYDASKKAMLLDSHLRVLRDSGFAWSTVLLSDGEFVHVNKGRLHFWRVVESDTMRSRAVMNAPCVFLSWEWVYQGVSQRGISTECWFAMKNANLCTGGWAFDPRRAIVEAAKCGVAIVRTGQFLNSLSGPGAPPVLRQLAFTGASRALIDRDVVAQRQEQMVLFLESILPCMDAIVEEEFELGLVKDDSDDFRKIFEDEIMWKVVDTALARQGGESERDYTCGICRLELTNIYKQCLGCTVHARRKRPNASYPVFRICVRCHAQPERHHFKPRELHGCYDKLCSSEGHTGLLPATRRYQAERSYFKCRCAPYVRCADCGGCESCCCLCHTLFQTRFRSAAPEHLDHLRTDVVDVIKWHKQQQQQMPTQHLARPHPRASGPGR